MRVSFWLTCYTFKPLIFLTQRWQSDVIKVEFHPFHTMDTILVNSEHNYTSFMWVCFLDMTTSFDGVDVSEWLAWEFKTPKKL